MGGVNNTVYVYSDESWEALKAICRQLPDTSISRKKEAEKKPEVDVSPCNTSEPINRG